MGTININTLSDGGIGLQLESMLSIPSPTTTSVSPVFIIWVAIKIVLSKSITEFIDGEDGDAMWK